MVVATSSGVGNTVDPPYIPQRLPRKMDNTPTYTDDRILAEDGEYTISFDNGTMLVKGTVIGNRFVPNNVAMTKFSDNQFPTNTDGETQFKALDTTRLSFPIANGQVVGNPHTMDVIRRVGIGANNEMDKPAAKTFLAESFRATLPHQLQAQARDAVGTDTVVYNDDTYNWQCSYDKVKTFTPGLFNELCKLS